MIALDTNIVVRLILNDDPDQTARARRLLAHGDVFLPLSVVLETGWVLSRRAGVSREDTVRALQAFLGVSGVVAEEPTRVRRALRLSAAGLDLGDAMHLCSSQACDSLASFDRRFARRAAALGASPAVIAP